MSFAAILRRRGRRIAIGFAGLVVVVGALVAGLSWYFSAEVVVPSHPGLPRNVVVDGVSGTAITLSSTKMSRLRGVYGLQWPRGTAIVGPILSAGRSTVTRQLCAVSGSLVRGTSVAVNGSVYTGNPAQSLGLSYANVLVPDPVGPMPAWLIGGSTSTWAILVHGINDDRDGLLRLVPTMQRAGISSLVITYRADQGAPRGPDGLHHMGLTEWRDLDAAAHYAISRGAQRLVLVGYSMGGSIVTQFMEHSSLAGRVGALILDAPALSWKQILTFQAGEMGFPAFLATPLEWTIGARISADWNELDALKHPGSFHLPILLFHGTADTVVPIATSDAFAKELPGWVTYYRVRGAEHTDSWNVDPVAYERAVAAFMARALGAHATAAPSFDPCA